MLYRLVRGCDDDKHENHLTGTEHMAPSQSAVRHVTNQTCSSLSVKPNVYFVLYRVVTGSDNEQHENRLTGTEHMVSIVSFEDGSRWLSDVGFGAQVLRHPLRIDKLDLDPPKDIRTYGTTFMIMCLYMCLVCMVQLPVVRH